MVNCFIIFIKTNNKILFYTSNIMTSAIEYSNIDKNAKSDLGEVTLRQGIKFKKYQSKIVKKVESKNLLFEGFQGLQGNVSMSNDGVTTSQALQNTQNLINQTDVNVTSQIKELRELQNKYKTLLEQYNGANGSLNVAIKDYVKKAVGKDSKNKNVYVNSVANNVKDNYLGCYADTNNRAMTGTASLSGQYVSYEQCKQSAIDSAFKYFGLQDFHGENQSGWCAVSNDLNATKQYGEALNDNAVALWASNTQGEGKTAELLTSGSLVVKDANGKVLFQTPTVSSCVEFFPFSSGVDYPGNDIYHFSGSEVNPQYCQDKCTADYNCGGFVMNTTNSECWIKGDMSGLTSNASNARNTYKRGLTKDARDKCQFSLVLQGDGNMCVYQNGSTNSVWCTMTNGKQQSQNPNWAALFGKYGTNMLTTGQVLGSDEWIGFIDGSLKLIMQSDGNLVLYTSNPQSNCIKGTNGNMYGGGWANAVYELDKVGIPGDLGKVGYVDDDSKLSEYPLSMFSINKTTNMPIINNNNSCTKKVETIDTLNWDAYAKTGVPMSQNTVCGLEKATQNENINRDIMRMQLAAIADEIVNKITYLMSLNTSLNNQMGIDKTVLQENLKKYQEISKQYSQYKSVDATNINGILSDSDIVVLQENYSYLFWSILAIAIVVITIHTIKK
jgi:hypothetical protein